MGTPDRGRSVFELSYSVAVLVKGVDGLVEFFLGAVLLVAPDELQEALLALAGELKEGSSSLAATIATYLQAVAGRIPFSGAGAIAFLLVHGVVKLVLVYCLVRRIARAYPWALLALIVLSGVQIWSAARNPSAAAWTLVGLDAVVLLLVVFEYRRLRSDDGRRRSTAAERAGT